ncbi:MAG: DsrE family protein [Synergistales bacterium]|nr:DsrE family protein [Synergistales bacterium]
MEERSTLVVIWSSDNREVWDELVFMYTLNSAVRGWWDRVVLVIWGPSAKLAGADGGIADNLRDAAAKGVELTACKACADHYGVSGRLEELGVDVRYMGEPLTAFLKSGASVLTF